MTEIVRWPWKVHISALFGSAVSVFELALCIPRDGTRCSVVYPDREIECALQYLVNAEVVNVSSMSSKAYVMCTVDRDRASIRARVEGYDDVSRPCRSLT